MAVRGGWDWLFDTASFRRPEAALGLSPGLSRTMFVSSLLVFLIFAAITLLLLLFLWPDQQYQVRRPRYFRERTTALSFAALIGATGLSALMRALMFVWPAYRCYALALALDAVVAFWVVAVMLPVTLRRETDQVRDERHAFANKVHHENLKITTNLMRLERLEKELSKLVAGLRQELP